MPSEEIPFLGPCPTGAAVEFLLPFTWPNWQDSYFEMNLQSPLLSPGLWQVFISYLEPVSFPIHRASGTDAWIANAVYDGIDTVFWDGLLDIDPDPGLDPLDATANARTDVSMFEDRIGGIIPQEGGECDCALDLQNTGRFDFHLQNRWEFSDAQWATYGVPEESEYLIHGIRLGN